MHPILIVDDNPHVRAALQGLCEVQSDLKVIGEVGTAKEALAFLKAHQPALVVLDISLGRKGPDGVELAEKLAKLYPNLPVLMLSIHNDKSHIRRALAAGAKGYVTKSEDTGILLVGIRQILAGGTYLSPKARAVAGR